MTGSILLESRRLTSERTVPIIRRTGIHSTERWLMAVVRDKEKNSHALFGTQLRFAVKTLKNIFSPGSKAGRKG